MAKLINKQTKDNGPNPDMSTYTQNEKDIYLRIIALLLCRKAVPSKVNRSQLLNTASNKSTK